MKKKKKTHLSRIVFNEFFHYAVEHSLRRTERVGFPRISAGPKSNRKKCR